MIFLIDKIKNIVNKMMRCVVKCKQKWIKIWKNAIYLHRLTRQMLQKLRISIK